MLYKPLYSESLVGLAKTCHPSAGHLHPPPLPGGMASVSLGERCHPPDRQETVTVVTLLVLLTLVADIGFGLFSVSGLGSYLPELLSWQ